MSLASAAVAAAFFGRTALSPLQEAMRLSGGLTDNQMAILQGPALALPLVLFALLVGVAVDRLSRTRLLQAWALIGIAGHVLTAVGRNFALWFIARSLVGLAAAVTIVAAVSLVADLYPSEARGRATMLLAIGQVGGSSVAFALGGTLLSVMSSDPSAWRSALYGMSIPWLLVLVALVALKEPSRSEEHIKRPHLRVAAGELWALRASILPLFGGVVVVDIALGAAPIWAAPDLSRTFGLSAAQIGALLAIVLFAAGLLGPVLGGLLADWAQKSGGPRRTLRVMSVVAALTTVTDLFATAPNAALAAILLFGFNLLVVAISVAVTALVTVLVPNELRGLCLSCLAAAQVLFGLGLAPVAVSSLSAALGGTAKIGDALTIVCVCASVLCALAFAIGSCLQPRATR